MLLAARTSFYVFSVLPKIVYKPALCQDSSLGLNFMGETQGKIMLSSTRLCKVEVSQELLCQAMEALITFPRLNIIDLVLA